MDTMPLLRRPPLLPGESLPSFLTRLAHANYYEPASLLAELLTPSNAATRGAYARRDSGYGRGFQAHLFTDDPTTLTRLTRLLRWEPAEAVTLLRATAHRFAPLLTPPHQEPSTVVLPGAAHLLTLPTDARQQIRQPQAAQFCPACLADAAYHHIGWAPRMVCLCLRHGCLLHDRCPACARRTPISAIALVRCQSCGADLRAAPLVCLEPIDWAVQAQRIVQGWLDTPPTVGGSPAGDERASESTGGTGSAMPPGFLLAPPAVLY